MILIISHILLLYIVIGTSKTVVVQMKGQGFRLNWFVDHITTKARLFPLIIIHDGVFLKYLNLSANPRTRSTGKHNYILDFSMIIVTIGVPMPETEISLFSVQHANFIIRLVHNKYFNPIPNVRNSVRLFYNMYI